MAPYGSYSYNSSLVYGKLYSPQSTTTIHKRDAQTREQSSSHVYRYIYPEVSHVCRIHTNPTEYLCHLGVTNNEIAAHLKHLLLL